MSDPIVYFDPNRNALVLTVISISWYRKFVNIDQVPTFAGDFKTLLGTLLNDQRFRNNVHNLFIEQNVAQPVLCWAPLALLYLKLLVTVPPSQLVGFGNLLVYLRLVVQNFTHRFKILLNIRLYLVHSLLECREVLLYQWYHVFYVQLVGKLLLYWLDRFWKHFEPDHFKSLVLALTCQLFLNCILFAFRTGFFYCFFRVRMLLGTDFGSLLKTVDIFDAK